MGLGSTEHRVLRAQFILQVGRVTVRVNVRLRTPRGSHLSPVTSDLIAIASQHLTWRDTWRVAKQLPSRS